MKLFQGAKTNSFFGSSLFIFFVRFFPALVTLLVTILFSRSLDPNVYGSYQFFWNNINVLYTLACFGIHAFIITYPPDFVLKLFRRITTRQFSLYALWLIAIGTVFSYFQFKEIHNRFPIPFMYLIMYAISLILESFLIVFKKFKTLISVNFLYLGVYYRHYRIKQLFFYLTLLMACRLLVFILVAKRKLKENIFAVNEDKPHAISMNVKTLWVHLGINDIIQMMSNSIDKFLVSHFFTTRLLAIYNNGTFNIPFLALILSAATSSLLQQLTKVKEADETKQILRVLNNSARITSCIIFPIFFFFFLYKYEFITTIFTMKYVRSVPIFAISLLVVPLKAYSFTSILQSKHKGAIINIGAIFEISAAILLMYPLYKIFGFPGAPLAFVITTYMQAAFYLYHTAKVLKVSMLKLIPFANWVAKLIIFGSLFIAIHYYTYRHFSALNSLILGVVSCIIIAGVSLLFELKQTRIKNGEALS